MKEVTRNSNSPGTAPFRNGKCYTRASFVQPHAIYRSPARTHNQVVQPTAYFDVRLCFAVERFTPVAVVLACAAALRWRA